MSEANFSHYIIDNEILLNSLMRYEKEVDTDYVSYDLETDSEIEKLAKIWGIGLAFSEKKAFYIAWRNKDGSKVWSDELEVKIISWLKQTLTSRKVIGHNIIYDVLVTENNFGFVLDSHIYADTILMKHTLDEEKPFALKEIAPRILGSWATNAQDDLKQNVLDNGGRWNESNKDMYLADTKILGKYCCWDVILTLMLFLNFSEKLKKEELEDLFYKDEVMPLYKEVTINMKRKGFKIDLEHFENLKKELKLEVDRIESEIFTDISALVLSFEQEQLDKKYPVKNGGNFPKAFADNYGIPLPKTKDGKITLAKKALEAQRATSSDTNTLAFYDFCLKTIGAPTWVTEGRLEVQRKMYFEHHPEKNQIFNLSSPDHIGYLIYKCLNIKPYKFTENGKPSTDKEVMDELIETYSDREPWLAKLSDYRKLGKLLSTYVDGILDRQIGSYIYTSMLQFGTTSGRYASRNPNCLSLDTQILTKRGWKNYDQLDSNTDIAAYSGKEVVWEKYNNYYLSGNEDKEMVSVKNQHFNMRLTDNHRIVYFDRKNKDKLHIKSAKEFPKDAKIYHGAYTKSDDIGFFKPWLQFLVACQADSEIRRDSSKIRFIFKKERKYKRLMEILSNLKYHVEDKSDPTKINRPYEILISGAKQAVIGCIGYEKEFPNHWVSMGDTERDILLNEIFEWDGLSTRKNNYSSNNESNVDFIQSLCVLHGWRAHKRTYRSLSSKVDNYQLDITKRNYSFTANCEVFTRTSTEKVWCVSVPSGMMVVRRGSDTFITGNCQNLPRIKDEDSKLSPLVLKYANSIKKGFVAPKGYKVVNADYAQLEAICFAHMSGDEGLRDVFRNGEDLYSKVGIAAFNIIGCSAVKKDHNYLKNIHPVIRQNAKELTLAIAYGAEAGQVSKITGKSYSESQEIIDNYLNGFPNLKKYMNRCNYLAKTTGIAKTELGRIRHLKEARSIYILFGEKILDSRWAKNNSHGDTRYKLRSLLNNAKNFPIQGLAAHLVNRAMLEVSRRFKKEDIDGWIGLTVHDEITCVVIESQADQAAKILQDCMENTTKLSIPLSAIPIIADNIADAK